MEKLEICGDWMTPTQAEMKELVSAVDTLPLPIIDGLLHEPAVRGLNFDMHYPSGGRNICSLKIIDESADEEYIDFDKSADKMVYLRLFTVNGRIAKLEFVAYLWVVGNTLHYSMGYPDCENADDESAEILTIQYFAAFAMIQFIMLYGAEKITYRKEYRKKLKTAKTSCLAAPYTWPGKVRVLEIHITADEVRERIRRKVAVHIWQCPAWGVRGHFRHYKTGKISYVKPYVKGKNKAAYTGREYAFPDVAAIKEVI